jgi:dipeptidyl aminopeptidase/acylaminoacyl peptidase
MWRRLMLGLALAGPLAGFVVTDSLEGQELVADFEPQVARSLDFELSIRNIMLGSEHVGEAPVGISWTDDSQWIYFSWRPGGGNWYDDRDFYRVPADGGEPELVPEEQADSLRAILTGGDLSRDRRHRVTSFDGDVFLVDRRSGDIRRLTRTAERESPVGFTRDGGGIILRISNNLFRLGLEDGVLEQITDIRPGPGPREERDAEGQRAFLEAQQEELFENIRVGKMRQEERETSREAAEARQLPTVYLAAGERAQGLTLSPGAGFVAIQASKPNDDDRGTMVPDWVTPSGYTEELNVRSKVGDAQGDSRMGILAVGTDQVHWLDLLPEEYREGLGDTDDPDYATLSFNGWNDAGTHGLITAVSFDYKTRWMYVVDGATGDLTLLDEWYDEAWVGGPCFFGCAGWIPESDRVYFSSEATGFAHLYAINADGTGRVALTEGEWEVHGVEIPEARTQFLIQASPDSPFDQHMYTMAFDGSDWTPLTSGAGQFNATPSPDGRRMAVVHSRANRPPELFVGRYREGAELEQVTVSPTAEWLTYSWIEPEIVEFQADDGTMVPARIYRPRDFGVEPNGAGVIFVHGAGYLHNVHRWWSSYYREYMFHHFMASQGYTVLDIDYRGSAGYGRNWRTGIYRWMGGKDLSDQVDGARYLVASEGVEAGRIGIYGGSYGGFITLMALFTAEDTFRAGAALRSVTDWAHYNHWYTSRILNLPQDDEEAYRKSSPIYFAENLRPDQRLLILHGMVDVNVHFSDVVRLAQRLIELGKENWEMAVYPVEDHGFVEPSSWTDEYRRIYELFREGIGPGSP